MATAQDWKPEEFPCTLYVHSALNPTLHHRATANFHLPPRTLHIPFPTAHLAQTAQRSLSVDAELSPLVRRCFTLVAPTDSTEESMLRVDYAATTNRMLRVAVNGFVESAGVVIAVMKELDTDVVYEPTREGLEGVQGLDMGMVG